MAIKDLVSEEARVVHEPHRSLLAKPEAWPAVLLVRPYQI